MKFIYLAKLNRLACNLVRKILYLTIRVYQCCISPFMVSSCRYYPSCSPYCRDSIDSLGVVKGCSLTVKRLARCHVFSQGGYDPVPENGNE